MVILFFTLMGAIIGSFCNVVIYRLPLMLKGEEITLSWPPSHCPGCRQRIRICHNIPILGWLMLMGRSACCGRAISWRYLTVEITMALLFTIIIWRQGITWQSTFDLFAVAMLIPLLFIDIDTMLLPDRLTLPFLLLALAFSASGRSVVEFHQAFIAAISGFGIPWFVARIYSGLCRKEGMGIGDMKLFAGLGAWLGPQALLDIILWSSVSALLVALVLLKTRPSQPFPFGPYPVIAAISWMLIHSSIM